MTSRRTLLAAPALLAAAPARAQGPAWPGSQPVTVVVPYAAGSASDLLGRIIQQGLQTRLGGSFVMDNRPGGSSTLASRYVKAARPDGHTLLLGTVAGMTIAPQVVRNPGFDPVEDFSHVSVLVDTVALLVANPRWRSLEELLAAAKRRPGELTYASWGVGGTGHLPMVELLRRADADMLHVPYTSSPPALTDVIAGRIDCMLMLLGAGKSHLAEGRLRALGVANPVRTDQLPDLPTIAEQGFPGFGIAGWYAMLGPKGVPEPILERLRTALAETLAEPAARETLGQNGFAPVAAAELGGPPLRARIQRDLVHFRELLARAGVQPE